MPATHSHTCQRRLCANVLHRLCSSFFFLHPGTSAKYIQSRRRCEHWPQHHRHSKVCWVVSLLLNQTFIFASNAGFVKRPFQGHLTLLHYLNSKATERQGRWQMRLSSLRGPAYGSNQGKWGSAGPAVISRRPHVHVSFNSSTRTSVD